MIAIALLLQLTAAIDSTYSSPALRDFVARAAVGNRAPPPELRGYSASIESELAFILRDSLGRELTGQVEQLAARASWQRDGRYAVHVVGYRAQTMGNPYSALTFTRMYSVPTLYGDRLVVGINDGVPRSRGEEKERQKRLARDSVAGLPSFRAVHPLARDRDRYYRFTGGDTVAVLYSAGRAIRLVRVIAEPIRDPTANFTGFHGELDFDADRHQLVRMRGTFVSMTSRRDPLFARATGSMGVAFVELENAEVDGKYWLPNVQRTEFQAQMGLMGDARPVYRIVTRFREHTTSLADGSPALDTAALAPLRATLTFARGDSASRFGDWRAPLGSQSSRVHADDFVDLAPDVWRPTGAPRLTFWPRRFEDVARYNRVEGLFTGGSATLAFRDAAPGLSARVSAGWAWAEETARGGAVVSLARGRWTNALRTERALATTNDFLLSLESGLSISPLFSGADDHDYVDRTAVAWSVSRVLRNIDRGFVSGEVAWVRDRHPMVSVLEPPVGGSAFRSNRAVLEGDYVRGTLALELHPRVTGDGMTPGVGARLWVEATQGDLEYQRVEARVAARQLWGPFSLSARLDGGAVFGSVIPPQMLFEMGGGLDLPSYEYKEFGGDRAAIGRGLAAWQIPILRRPVRLGRLMLPGVSPGIGVGAQGGWTEASSAAARVALGTFGSDGVTPLSRPTGRIRSTIDARLMLLSGAIGFGLARPVDEAGAWRPFFIWGASF